MANLNIKTGFKEGKSYLIDSYVSVPFRITNVGQVKDDGCLYMMLGSSSPGLLDSDNHKIEINIEENSRFQLQTQSYQRLYNMKQGSSQITQVTLAPNSSFCYVPHPVVPQENSIFRNQTIINLEKDCELILSEIITCGRKNSEYIYPRKKILGEIFRFTYFQNVTEIYFKDLLVLKDKIILEPRIKSVNTVIQLEEYTHQATFIYMNTKNINGVYQLTEKIEVILESLKNERDISFGISEMAENGFVLRVLGNGGEQLFNCFQQIKDFLWDRQEDCALSGIEGSCTV
ncbi:MAG: urease accessory protein [Nitrosomonadaceae bacterium]|nr:urease accessory protein [Nitrosomonadaceae bacterium]|tara:strand:- start:1344 stop:2207 length:864 start_codon:yes stop_codon:yes gene_type:complete